MRVSRRQFPHRPGSSCQISIAQPPDAVFCRQLCSLPFAVPDQANGVVLVMLLASTVANGHCPEHVE